MLSVVRVVAVVGVLTLASCGSAAALSNNETAARKWLSDADPVIREVVYQASVSTWNYATNLTEYNKQIMIKGNLQQAVFQKEVYKNASAFDWQNFKDDDLRRQFLFATQIGTDILPDKDLARMAGLASGMEATYSTGLVCGVKRDDPSACLPLEPDLTNILAKSRNWDELLRAWKGFRDVTGKKIKGQYSEYVTLANKAAKMNDYKDHGDYWRSFYEMEDFPRLLEDLWQQVKPLYQQLHSYVRRTLKESYKGFEFPTSGHIPAHLLGNMWGQQWDIMAIVAPYKDVAPLDVSPALVEQNYTTRKMFEMSEDFFKSLGFNDLPASFWTKSMLEKPTDGRDVVCHASAWDFMAHDDFRIKMCTDLTMNNLITIHHEMGHTQYQMQYKDQPFSFRNGANPGFHEAVGDVMSLSVSTPKHLQRIGLLPNAHTNEKLEINYLMQQGLEKLAFLPFGYLIDKWRWGVFSGETKPEDYNREWWKLRCKYQGISPPVARSDSDFDPGAKYHIPSDTPYIRYFVSYIVQFQFHEALCREADFEGPLHQCDIYRSKRAGKKLRAMLSMGASKSWPEAMQVITGQRKMDARPLLAYFQPLADWLAKENKGHAISWRESCPRNSFSNVKAAAVTHVSSYVILTSALLAWCVTR